MNELNQDAYAIYARKVAERTVWIVSTPDKRFVAVRLDGTEVVRGTFAASVEAECRKLAADPVNNIWAIATVTDPKKRHPERGANKPRARSRYGRY